LPATHPPLNPKKRAVKLWSPQTNKESAIYRQKRPPSQKL
jgi:hypothetical protein